MSFNTNLTNIIFLTSVGNLVHLQGRSTIKLHSTVLASHHFYLMGSLVCIKSGIVLKRFCTHITREFLFIRVAEFVPVQSSRIGILGWAFVADKDPVVNFLEGGHPSSCVDRFHKTDFSDVIASGCQ